MLQLIVFTQDGSEQKVIAYIIFYNQDTRLTDFSSGSCRDVGIAGKQAGFFRRRIILFRTYPRKGKPEGGTRSQFTFRTDMAAQLLYDTFTDRQAEPGS